MRWLMNKDGEYTGEVWDDGVCTPCPEGTDHGPGPGDEWFTCDLVDAELARRNAEDPEHVYTADWMGFSWPPAPPEGGE